MRPLAEPARPSRPLADIVEDWKAGRRVRVEDCACGGEVRAESGSDGDVLVAVRQHQVEPVHIAYDRAQGIALASWQMRALAVDGGR